MRAWRSAQGAGEVVSGFLPLAGRHVGRAAYPPQAQEAGVVELIGEPLVGGRCQTGVYPQNVSPLQGAGGGVGRQVEQELLVGRGRCEDGVVLSAFQHEGGAEQAARLGFRLAVDDDLVEARLSGKGKVGLRQLALQQQAAGDGQQGMQGNTEQALAAQPVADDKHACSQGGQTQEQPRR